MFTSLIVSTALQVALAASTPFPFPFHPHVPKAIVVGGAGGNVTVTYFTVPYNPVHLKDLQPGFSWHLGFAAVKTDVPLEVGTTSVPAGNYKLNARYTEDGWHFELQNFQLAQAGMRAQFSRGQRKEQAQAKYEELKARLAKSGGDKVYVLKAGDFEGVKDEHLEVSAMLHGFEAVRRFSDQPKGGVKFELRIGFGDIHRAFSVSETFDASSQPARRGKGKGRRGQGRKGKGRRRKGEGRKKDQDG